MRRVRDNIVAEGQLLVDGLLLILSRSGNHSHFTLSFLLEDRISSKLCLFVFVLLAAKFTLSLWCSKLRLVVHCLSTTSWSFTTRLEPLEVSDGLFLIYSHLSNK